VDRLVDVDTDEAGRSLSVLEETFPRVVCVDRSEEDCGFGDGVLLRLARSGCDKEEDGREDGWRDGDRRLLVCGGRLDNDDDLGEGVLLLVLADRVEADLGEGGLWPLVLDDRCDVEDLGGDLGLPVLAGPLRCLEDEGEGLLLAEEEL